MSSGVAEPVFYVDPPPGVAGYRTLGPGSQQAARGSDLAAEIIARLAGDAALAAELPPAATASGKWLRDKAGGLAWDTPAITDLAQGGAADKQVVRWDSTGGSWVARLLDETSMASSIKDGGASTPSLRTLGTGAQQAAAGNDARLSDSRAPTGAASGDLTGAYPGPSIADLAVTDAKVAAANKDGSAGTPSLRTLGPGAQQSAPGDLSTVMPAGLISARPGASGGPPLYVSTDEPGGPRIYQNTGTGWRLLSVLSGEIDVTQLGAKCDAVLSRTASDTSTGSMTSGSAVVTGGIAGAAGMVGKTAIVRGAGPAGATLVTTVASINGSNQPVLAAAASTSVTATDIVIGTDDSAAYTAANLLVAAGFGRRRIRLGNGGSITTTTIGPADVVGWGQEESWVVAAAGYGPMIQSGQPPPFSSALRGEGCGRFHLLGMGLAQGLIHMGRTAQTRLYSVNAEYSAPGYYGLRLEAGQNFMVDFVQLSNIGGNCLELDSGAGGHAFYKCEFNNPGVGTTSNTYYNLTLRQTSGFTVGGYKNPTDLTFRDCIFERGTLGKSGTIYVGSASTRILFDGCNFALTNDISTTAPGFVRAGVTMQFENHDTVTGDPTTGKNGGSANAGVTLRDCTIQGTLGKIQLNANSPTDGWVVVSPSWTIDVDVATGGTFTLTETISGTTVGPYAYNASTATIQAGMDTIFGAGNSLVTGAAPKWTVTLQGTKSPVDPNAAAIALTGNGSALTGPSTVNFAVGKVNSASPTIAVLVNAGGSQVDLVIDGGRFMSHGAVFALDDDCAITLRGRPAMFSYGDLFLNPPQRITTYGGSVITRGSANSLTLPQIAQQRPGLSAFRTPGTYTDASAGQTTTRPVIDGDVRVDSGSGGDGRVRVRVGGVWGAQALLSDVGTQLPQAVGFWFAPPGTTSTTLFAAGTVNKMFGSPIDVTSALTALKLGLEVAVIGTVGSGALFRLGICSMAGNGRAGNLLIDPSVLITDAAITSGQAVLTSASGRFTAALVGTPVIVNGAGAAGAALATTVLSYQSATQITLAANAGTTVTAATANVNVVDATTTSTANPVLLSKALTPGRYYLVMVCQVVGTPAAYPTMRIINQTGLTNVPQLSMRTGAAVNQGGVQESGQTTTGALQNFPGMTAVSGPFMQVGT